MMQPMNIKSHSFGTGLFGYKKIDVDQYVDTVYSVKRRIESRMNGELF